MISTRDLLHALTPGSRLDVKVNGVVLILERRGGVVVVLREASVYGRDVLGLFHRLSDLSGRLGFPVIFQERMYVANSCAYADEALAEALRIASHYSL